MHISFTSPKPQFSANLFSQQAGKATPLFIVIALLAVAIGIFVQTSEKKPTTIELEKLIILPTPKAIEHANFTDHEGNSFGKPQFEGKWSILFFGFTHCPDICPTTMATLKQVKQKVSETSAWNSYQVVMVTVDPERDTSERLASYVPFFDKEFIGLSSDIATTEKFAKQLGILFVKRDPKANNPEVYDVDHSASLIVLNPNGEYAGVISAPHKADEISRDLIQLANYTGDLPEKPKASGGPSASNKEASKVDELKPFSGLSMAKAWIRPAPPSAASMAAYFELSNHTDKDITIVDSEGTGFGMTMIHETVVENGLAGMEHLDELVVPAKSTINLKPMGTHMMLMRPKKPLNVGDKTIVALIDDNDTRYSFEIEVRDQVE